MKIVILEDEKAVAEFLAQSIRTSGYKVQHFEELAPFHEFLTQQHSDPPQVFVLDRLIHREDTADLLLKIKASFPDSKILFLSAIGTSGEKIKLLNAGADDYMSKPFSIEELIARIGVLCRRNLTSQTANILEVGNVSLNTLHHTVDVEGKRLELSKKEFQLLALLLSQPTRVFSRLQLLQKVWDSPEETASNVVEVTMKNLRKKLIESAAKVKIQSKRYLGYWLEV